MPLAGEPSAAQQQPWPAGALLPDTSALAQWASRTFRAAKAEITHVVDGMIDDLEDLSAAACAGLGTRRLHLNRSERDDEADSNTDDDLEDDPCIRVHDLCPPTPTRDASSATQSEEEDDDAEHSCASTTDEGLAAPSDEAFEMINFEQDACIIALEDNDMSCGALSH